MLYYFHLEVILLFTECYITFQRKLYYFFQPLRKPCVGRLCRALPNDLLTRQKTPSPPFARERRKGKEKRCLIAELEDGQSVEQDVAALKDLELGEAQQELLRLARVEGDGCLGIVATAFKFVDDTRTEALVYDTSADS